MNSFQRGFVLVFLALTGCAPQSDSRDFSTILAQLEQAAKAKSVGSTSITVASGPVTETQRTVQLTRLRKDAAGTVLATVEMSVQFDLVGNRWICTSAKSREVESNGNHSEHNISGTEIAFDQLLIWLQLK